MGHMDEHSNKKENIMCLYPRLLKNPKYKPNKKNGGIIPPVSDYRTTVVPVSCGNCMECMKAKQREWKVRLMEDIKENMNGKFLTLTFSDENYTKLGKEIGLEGYTLDNKIATLATRRFLERWRKKFKKSVRHWLITELGHNGTENIHIHGIIWTDETPTTVRELWHYGYIWPRYDTWENNYVTERTVNYICKYVTKVDMDHKNYKPVILTSAGIGKCYTNSYNAKVNKYKGEETKETYTTRDGLQISMPIYWRNKIYTDEEREKLWINKLNKNTRWVNGNKIDTSTSMEEYWRAINYARKLNKELGYGNIEKDYDRIEYEKQLRILKQQERQLKTLEKDFEKHLKEGLLYLSMKEAKEDFDASGGVFKDIGEYPPTPLGGVENGEAKLFIDTDL